MNFAKFLWVPLSQNTSSGCFYISDEKYGKFFNNLNHYNCITVGTKAAIHRFSDKRCSENMQKIYMRTPVPKCDFNEFEKKLKISSKFIGELPSRSAILIKFQSKFCKFAVCFQNTFFLRTPLTSGFWWVVGCRFICIDLLDSIYWNFRSNKNTALEI